MFETKSGLHFVFCAIIHHSRSLTPLSLKPLIYMDYITQKLNHLLLALYSARLSLIHFACIGVAPPRLFTPLFACSVNSQGGATPMQAKWIKLDPILHYTQTRPTLTQPTSSDTTRPGSDLHFFFIRNTFDC